MGFVLTFEEAEKTKKKPSSVGKHPLLCLWDPVSSLCICLFGGSLETQIGPPLGILGENKFSGMFLGLVSSC